MLWKLFATAVLVISAPARGAVIDGSVVEKLTGRPLARARVVLLPLRAGDSSRAPVFTNSTGYFSISSLGAGAYILTAEKRGYATASYGQKRWNGPGTPVVVEKDSRFTAELRLSKLGAVSGTVVDENGVGIPATQVYAYKDVRPLRLTGQAASDDRGVFRIAGLEPGPYRIRTGSKELEDQTGLLPTYFGDSTGADGSTRVDVRLDDETAGLLIRPEPGTLLHLSGRVNFPAASSVALYADMTRRLATPDSAGRFSFDGLAPGRVELIAESGSPRPTHVGYSSLWLSADQDNVVLDAAPAPVVQFRCDDAGGKPFKAREVTAMLTRTSPAEDPRAQQLECGGSAPVSVGTWSLTVFTPGRYAISEVMIERRPSGANTFPAAPGQAVEIAVTLGSSGAALKGKLLGASGVPAVGAMVFLSPIDPGGARLLFGKGTARTDANGEFALEGLPPGRYRVAGSFDAQTPEEVDWTNPSVLSVELRAGETLTSDVRLAP